MSPNFLLAPGTEAIGMDDLIKDTARGVYFPSGWASVDQQARNGLYANAGIGANGPREIRNGRLGPVLIGAAVLFESRELWKNVTALGGEPSTLFTRAEASKGEPAQRSPCNVRAVPMKVSGCAVINFTKKA
jgi:predicted Zn-dependent protease